MEKMAKKLSKYADFPLTMVEVMLSYDRSQITYTLKGGTRNQEELGGVEKTETESERTRSRGRTAQEKGPRQQGSRDSYLDGSGHRISHSHRCFDSSFGRLKRSGGGGVIPPSLLYKNITGRRRCK